VKCNECVMSMAAGGFAAAGVSMEMVVRMDLPWRHSSPSPPRRLSPSLGQAAASSVRVCRSAFRIEMSKWQSSGDID
jgi:hypothetical protein